MNENFFAWRGDYKIGVQIITKFKGTLRYVSILPFEVSTESLIAILSSFYVSKLNKDHILGLQSGRKISPL